MRWFSLLCTQYVPDVVELEMGVDTPLIQSLSAKLRLKWEVAKSRGPSSNATSPSTNLEYLTPANV